MDKIYNFEQYQGLNLDYSLIVNSTLDIKHGSILCINNEDADKLDYLINQALKKDVDKILTSSKSKISSEKVFRFGDYEKVFDDVLYNIYLYIFYKILNYLFLNNLYNCKILLVQYFEIQNMNVY